MDHYKILDSIVERVKNNKSREASELTLMVETEIRQKLGLSKNDVIELAGLLGEIGSPTNQFTAYNVSTQWIATSEYALKKLGMTIKSTRRGDGSVKISWEKAGSRG
ncbi:MAG: hypothetical protein LBB14_01930 [Puniceicoccales bacterium]|jgi:hypothetical protein|nr:hypothetical protein [Puniceicoccales bacterium]